MKRPAAPVAPRENRTALGVGMMALAVVCFTSIDTSAKWLILAGLAPLQVVFIRYAGHFVLALAVSVPRNGFADFRSNAPARQLIRSVFLFSGTVFNFLALQYLPLTFTTTIFFASPVIVTLAAIPILGEKVGLRRLAAVCVGFVGVVIAMQPWGASFHPAMFLSLCALLCASGYFVMTRMLAGVESNATSQLWSSAMGTLALAPFGLTTWVVPQSATDIFVMVMIGSFGFIAHVLMTYASRFADASDLAPVVYIQIVFAALASIIFFATYPTYWTLLGGLIIVASGIYIWHRERQKAARRTA